MLELEDLRVVRCEHCGFAYVDGDRSLEDQQGIYQRDQFEDGYMRTYDMARIADEQVQSLRLTLLKSKVGLGALEKRLPVLDIGCARGHFLHALALATRMENLVGIDTSVSMTAWGRREFGLDLRGTSFETAVLPAEHFGVVTMFDVLEHVASPRETLKKIMSLLRPGGWAVLEVPSEKTLFRALAKLGYRAMGVRVKDLMALLYHRAHLSYFTSESLRTLIASVGGTNIKIITKEAHITRFGLGRFRFPARAALRVIALMDRAVGSEAKLLCGFQKRIT